MLSFDPTLSRSLPSVLLQLRPAFVLPTKVNYNSDLVPNQGGRFSSISIAVTSAPLSEPARRQ